MFQHKQCNQTWKNGDIHFSNFRLQNKEFEVNENRFWNMYNFCVRWSKRYHIFVYTLLCFGLILLWASWLVSWKLNSRRPQYLLGIFCYGSADSVSGITVLFLYKAQKNLASTLEGNYIVNRMTAFCIFSSGCWFLNYTRSPNINISVPFRKTTNFVDKSYKFISNGSNSDISHIWVLFCCKWTNEKNS